MRNIRPYKLNRDIAHKKTRRRIVKRGKQRWPLLFSKVDGRGMILPPGVEGVGIEDFSTSLPRFERITSALQNNDQEAGITENLVEV